MAACLNSRTGFTHVEWLYCILHSKSKATAPWMWSNAALNWIVVSNVSSRLWVVGSNCWCWCFALSNMALQLFDLVDRLNTMPRKTGLVPSYRWWKSLEMFVFFFYTATAVLDTLEWLCSFAWQKTSLRKCKAMVGVGICVHLWLFLSQQ